MKKQYITPSIIVLDVCISNHLLRFSKAVEDTTSGIEHTDGWNGGNGIDVDNGEDDIWGGDFL